MLAIISLDAQTQTSFGTNSESDEVGNQIRTSKKPREHNCILVQAKLQKEHQAPCQCSAPRLLVSIQAEDGPGSEGPGMADAGAAAVTCQALSRLMGFKAPPPHHTLTQS